MFICSYSAYLQGGTEKSGTYRLPINNLLSCGLISLDAWVKVY